MVSSHQVNFSQLRENAISMSQRQIELRQKLQAYLSKTKKTVAAAARDSGVTRISLSRFLSGEQAFVSETVPNLAEMLGVRQLGEDIVTLSNQIADRYIGLVHFDEGVITLVCDLLDTFGSLLPDYKMADFAAVFTGHEAIVSGALLCSREALAELRDQPEIIDKILAQLIDNEFDTRLQAAKETLTQQRLVKVEEVERLVAALLPYYGDKGTLVHELGFKRGSLDRAKLTRSSDTQLDTFVGRLTQALESAKAADEELEKLGTLYRQLHEWLGNQKQVALALGVAPSTLSDALYGKSSKDTISRLLARASELASQPQPQALVEEPAAPAVDLEPEPVERVVTQEPPPDDPFHGLAGETIQGVKHVLTADNYRQIEGQSAAAVVNALLVAMQTTTGFLALVAQMKGDEIRRAMQQPLIERTRVQLYQTLQLAENSDPTPLLPLFDQQREFLWGMSDPKKPGKGGANHG